MENFYRSRLRRVEEAKAKQSAFTADPEHYQFRMACSCPPDKRLHMRGGLMYDRVAHDGWFVEETTIDFTNSTQVNLISFTTANYYMGLILVLTDGGYATPYTFGLLSSGSEFATAAEAEEDLLDYAELGGVWDRDYPLCGIIFHNDGNAGVDAAFLPIEPINRGNSYLWPQDWRPRNIAL